MTLVKTGNAYHARLNSGHVWVKRTAGTWNVLYRFTDPHGDRRWSTLGRHATKSEALTDAEALIAA